MLIFVTNREDVKFLTKSRQNDVAIRDQKRVFFSKSGVTPIYLQMLRSLEMTLMLRVPLDGD